MSQRVVEEDPDQLPDHVLVARDGRAVYLGHQLMFWMNRLRLAANLDHDRFELERSELQLQARIRPRESQHPIDESSHARCFVRDIGRCPAPDLITIRPSPPDPS